MRILISSGGTKVDIDPVRYIMNMSRGTMGANIARQALINNDEVHFLTSDSGRTPFKLELDYNKLRPGMSQSLISEVEQLHDDCGHLYTEFVYRTYDDYRTKMFALPKCFDYDAIIMVAAVSDYAVEYSENKTKSDSEMSISLTPTEKIIDKMREISPKSKLVGFKLLNDAKVEDIQAVCDRYLVSKRLNMMIGNDLKALRDGKYYQVHATDQESTIVNSDFEETILERLYSL